MNSSNNGIECESLENGYGEEVMYAGWNPIVSLPYDQQQFVSGNQQMNTIADPAVTDAELFLKKMYACQR